MWINLQGKHVNFNTIEYFYIEDNNLITVNLEHRHTLFSYGNREKVNRVYKFLIETLRTVDVNLVIDD
jgi:hypothetical protein